MISPLPDASPPAKRAPAATLDWRVRAAVAVRTVAAIGGGYLLASLATRALAITLPMAAVDAVVTATLTGLVVYPCAVMWCFAARTVPRACLGLAAACALPTLVVLAHQSAAAAG